MQKNWNEVFFKILEEPSMVQKKMIPHIKGLDFSQRWSKKKNQNGRLRKFKMAASKKPRFPAPPILNIFSWNFYGLVLGLVELIDAKGIEMSQLIWSWGCPTNSLKTQKTHFLSVFELMKKYWELTVWQNEVFLSRPFWIFFSKKKRFFFAQSHKK